jgi:curved DNA-binding protein CbpA
MTEKECLKLLNLKKLPRTVEEVDAAYRPLAMQYHPDRNHGDQHAREMFELITLARDDLKKHVHPVLALWDGLPNYSDADPILNPKPKPPLSEDKKREILKRMRWRLKKYDRGNIDKSLSLGVGSFYSILRYLTLKEIYDVVKLAIDDNERGA